MRRAGWHHALHRTNKVAAKQRRHTASVFTFNWLTARKMYIVLNSIRESFLKKVLQYWKHKLRKGSQNFKLHQVCERDLAAREGFATHNRMLLLTRSRTLRNCDVLYRLPDIRLTSSCYLFMSFHNERARSVFPPLTPRAQDRDASPSGQRTKSIWSSFYSPCLENWSRMVGERRERSVVLRKAMYLAGTLYHLDSLSPSLWRQ